MHDVGEYTRALIEERQQWLLRLEDQRDALPPSEYASQRRALAVTLSMLADLLHMIESRSPLATGTDEEITDEFRRSLQKKTVH